MRALFKTKRCLRNPERRYSRNFVNCRNFTNSNTVTDATLLQTLLRDESCCQRKLLPLKKPAGWAKAKAESFADMNEKLKALCTSPGLRWTSTSATGS